MIRPRLSYVSAVTRQASDIFLWHFDARRKRGKEGGGDLCCFLVRSPACHSRQASLSYAGAYLCKRVSVYVSMHAHIFALRV